MIFSESEDGRVISLEIPEINKKVIIITGEQAFLLHSEKGIPIEYQLDIAKDKSNDKEIFFIAKKSFNKFMEKHKELSKKNCKFK